MLLSQLHDVSQVVADRDSPGEHFHVVGFGVPFLAQRTDRAADRAGLGVLGRSVLGSLTSMLGSEVGAVAGERRDPLLARLVEVSGDEVGSVDLAAASHPDVHRRGTGVLTEHYMRCGGSGALRAVRGSGVGELDMRFGTRRAGPAPLPSGW